MMDYYAKLSANIPYSSMWEEDGDTCKIWITFLALKGMDGIVKKNATGISRLCKIPLEKCLEAIKKFESPDPQSTSKKHAGRRLLQLEGGGWQVVNHEEYMALGWTDEKKEYEKRRKAAWRARQDEKTNVPIGAQPEQEPPAPRFKPPTIDEVKLAIAKAGLPDVEAQKFFNHYESNGWRVGKNKMRSMSHSIGNWAITWREKQNETNQRTAVRRENRNDGTYNAKSTSDYNAAMVRTPKSVPDAPGQGTGENAGASGTVAG